MPIPLADTGCPKKRMLSVERQAEFITGQIGQMPNPKGCRRGTGNSLNAGEMKLNWWEKLRLQTSVCKRNHQDNSQGLLRIGDTEFQGIA